MGYNWTNLSELQVAFFKEVGATLGQGIYHLPLVNQDHVQIFSLKRDENILIVLDNETKEQYSFDISAGSIRKLREREIVDSNSADNITDIVFKTHDANHIPCSRVTMAPTKYILVGGQSNGFYKNLIRHFDGEGDAVFISDVPGRAQDIANFARDLGVKNHGRFKAMSQEDVLKIDASKSILVTESRQLNFAKKIYGDQYYFDLMTPDDESKAGVYAFGSLGALMDLVSTKDWNHAFELYRQMKNYASTITSVEDLQKALSRGALPIPYVTTVISRLINQVYMAELALEGSA